MSAPQPDAPRPAPASLGAATLCLALSLLAVTLIARFGASLGEARGAAIVAGWLLPFAIEARLRGLDPFLALGLTRPRGGRWTLLLCYGGLAAAALIAPWVSAHPHPVDAAEAARILAAQLLFVALGEECAFRGGLQPALCERLGEVAGLLVTAALFGLAHLLVDGSPARLLTALPGLAFGLLRLRTGSILPSILLHALSNLLAATYPLVQLS